VVLLLIVSWCAFGQSYTIQTVAGSETAGFSGDNGPAIDSDLDGPQAVAVDASGNLYIADSQNNRIRKVSEGVIATIAGSGPAGNGTGGYGGDNGPATGALLNYPQGIVVDAAGSIYIADSRNCRVRKVTNGVVATVAGNGTCGNSGDNGPATSAALSYPVSVALDATGNLYIVDGNLIREVSNGVITTVAGNSQPCCADSGDGGPATGATLYGPVGVAVDAAGNLYIADSAGARIRKVTNGVITTVAGGGSSHAENVPATSAAVLPASIAVDATGNLYIADGENQTGRIRRISGGIITTAAGGGGFDGESLPATSASLNVPSGVAVDANGNVYVAESGNNRIRVLTCCSAIPTYTIQEFAGSGVLGWMIGDGGPAAGASLMAPSGVAVDAHGDVYIADHLDNVIRKVSNGIITTPVGNWYTGLAGDGGPATRAQLTFPMAVALDASGNLYIADTGNNRIRRVSNGVIATVAGSGDISTASSADCHGGFRGDNGPATSAELACPQGIAVDASGDLYIADTENHRIRKVSNGIITTVAGSGPSSWDLGGFGGDGGPATSALLNFPGASPWIPPAISTSPTLGTTASEGFLTGSSPPLPDKGHEASAAITAWPSAPGCADPTT
jgi:sugar lactone lactonase YvrE